jgi:hypothetical protein
MNNKQPTHPLTPLNIALALEKAASVAQRNP